jgi:hypothetical protein
MWPLPSVNDLSGFSGRPAVSYTSYVNSALLQAALMFTYLAERNQDDFGSMSADDQQLANTGVMAMADYLYLRWPYQQVLASPLQSETIGSYTYQKPFQEMARNAQAMEVFAERTGVDLFDLAVRMLAKRTKANGVYFGQISGFERFNERYDGVGIHWDSDEQRMVLVGPSDRDQLEMVMFDINAPIFPSDPGVLF